MLSLRGNEAVLQAEVQRKDVDALALGGRLHELTASEQAWEDKATRLESLQTLQAQTLHDDEERPTPCTLPLKP